MGARLLNYKDNRAANSMSAEKLQPKPFEGLTSLKVDGEFRLHSSRR